MFYFRNGIKKINPDRRGFTLVEIILVACLTAVIGAALYAAFSQGARLARAAAEAKPFLDLDILYDKMTVDLRNVIPDPPGAFSGNEEVFQFVTLSSEPAGAEMQKKFGEFKRPLLVGYYYDSHEQALVKMRKEYTDVLNADPRKKPDGKVILKHVKNCKFSYYGGRNQRGDRVWRKLWKEKCLPKGVRIVIELDDLKKNRKMDQVIAIQGETCSGASVGPA